MEKEKKLLKNIIRTLLVFLFSAYLLAIAYAGIYAIRVGQIKKYNFTQQPGVKWISEEGDIELNVVDGYTGYMVLLIDGEEIELYGKFGSNDGLMQFCHSGDNFDTASTVESWRWSYRTRDKFVAYVMDSYYFENGLEIIFVKQK